MKGLGCRGFVEIEIAAFPFIHKLLLLFNLSNTSLLIGTTVVSYVAFALLYTLAYKLTSNAYYHIVSGAAERE